MEVFQAAVNKGNSSAKGSIEQANQVYDLLIAAATKYYANKDDNSAQQIDPKKSTDPNANDKKQS